jgi:hypothetical protein
VLTFRPGLHKSADVTSGEDSSLTPPLRSSRLRFRGVLVLDDVTAPLASFERCSCASAAVTQSQVDGRRTPGLGGSTETERRRVVPIHQSHGLKSTSLYLIKPCDWRIVA